MPIWRDSYNWRGLHMYANCSITDQNQVVYMQVILKIQVAVHVLLTS